MFNNFEAPSQYCFQTFYQNLFLNQFKSQLKLKLTSLEYPYRSIDFKDIQTSSMIQLTFDFALSTILEFSVLIINLKTIMTSTKNNPERVTQLQCQQLDNEFQNTFHGFSSEALKYYPNLANSIKHQLQLIINYLYFRLTTARDEPEPGNYLQNIIYCAAGKTPLSKLQKLGFLILSVVLPYIKVKIQSKVKNQKIKKLLFSVDSFLKIFEYINLVLFIKDGIYRSITQRLLKIQMKFIDPNRSRILDFSLMNRQLLWSVYQNFLSSVLPFVKNFLNTHLKKIFYLYSYIDVDAVDKSCIVCGQSQVTLPQSNDGCSHLACYYCMSNITGGKMHGKCRSCSKSFNRWMPFVPGKS